MSTENQGRKPDHEGGRGQDESATQEVGGRRKMAPVSCWKCGTTNWVPEDWAYFTCRGCDSLSYMI